MRYLLVVLLCVVPISTADAEVSVSGRVLAQDGRPVPGALVGAYPINDKGIAADIHWTKTDSNARFHLDLSSGKYVIRAKDEVSGYPDPSFKLNFDPTARFPEISVGGKNIPGVTVVLGTRGGTVSGRVQDAKTARPVAGAKVRIQDADDPDKYVEVFSNISGHFEYSVPSRPILLSVAAPGYTPSKPGQIKLSGGEHRDLAIELQHE